MFGKIIFTSLIFLLGGLVFQNEFINTPFKRTTLNESFVFADVRALEGGFKTHFEAHFDEAKKPFYKSVFLGKDFSCEKEVCEAVL